MDGCSDVRSENKILAAAAALYCSRRCTSGPAVAAVAPWRDPSEILVDGCSDVRSENKILAATAALYCSRRCTSGPAVAVC